MAGSSIDNEHSPSPTPQPACGQTERTADRSAQLASQLRRLNKTARRNPRAVAAMLDYWLTPSVSEDSV